MLLEYDRLVSPSLYVRRPSWAWIFGWKRRGTIRRAWRWALTCTCPFCRLPKAMRLEIWRARKAPRASEEAWKIEPLWGVAGNWASRRHPIRIDKRRTFRKVANGEIAQVYSRQLAGSIGVGKHAAHLLRFCFQLDRCSTLLVSLLLAILAASPFSGWLSSRDMPI